jgi:hypothetical protein
MPPPGDYFIDSGLVRNYLVQRFVKQDETRYTVRLDHNDYEERQGELPLFENAGGRHSRIWQRCERQQRRLQRCAAVRLW